MEAQYTLRISQISFNLVSTVREIQFACQTNTMNKGFHDHLASNSTFSSGEKMLQSVISQSSPLHVIWYRDDGGVDQKGVWLQLLGGKPKCRSKPISYLRHLIVFCSVPGEEALCKLFSSCLPERWRWYSQTWLVLSTIKGGMALTAVSCRESCFFRIVCTMGVNQHNCNMNEPVVNESEMTRIA